MSDKTYVLAKASWLTKSPFNSSERRNRVIPIRYQMLGLGLNLASRFRVEWAAGILSNLWFTVFKSKPQTWIRQFWQQADSCVEIQLKDKSIPVYLWGEGPLVVMMHGWSGSGVQFRRLVPGLVEAGFQVAVFDAPSHGSNPGKHSHLMEFVDSLIAIEQQIGRVHTMMAHSLGGMAAVMATQRGLSVEKMVLFGPHLDVQEMYESYRSLLNLNSALSERFREKIGRKMADILGEENVWALLTPEKLLEKSDCQGMLIYDSEDEEIPQEQFKAVDQHWVGCQTMETKGLGHRQILKNELVVENVLGFMGRADGETVAFN